MNRLVIANAVKQSMTSEGMDRHGLRPRDDANNTAIASPPYPARCRTRTLNRAFVTASPSMNSGQAKARQSMQSRDMDCFTAFVMTATFTMTGLFLERNAATWQSVCGSGPDTAGFP
ncbi:MAG: hypothetical protein WA012_13545 [Rhodoferax sp.]